MKYKKGGSGKLRADFVMLGTLWEGEEADALTCPVGRWWVSEKMDGMRALWDGAGGLWSRYGSAIAAPGWWTERLPRGICLDGELWAGRGSFQKVMSICRTQSGARDAEWEGINYKAFDVLRAVGPGVATVGGDAVFENKLKVLESPALIGIYHPQFLFEGGQSLEGALSTVCKPPSGPPGEGLMMRLGSSVTVAGTVRSRALLKVKPLRTGTGTVVGVTPGKGRHVGRVGALVVSDAGLGCTFSLSGMTDLERDRGEDWVGRVVRYKYRELSDSGVPREARFVEVVNE